MFRVEGIEAGMENWCPTYSRAASDSHQTILNSASLLEVRWWGQRGCGRSSFCLVAGTKNVATKISAIRDFLWVIYVSRQIFTFFTFGEASRRRVLTEWKLNDVDL